MQRRDLLVGSEPQDRAGGRLSQVGGERLLSGREGLGLAPGHQQVAEKAAVGPKWQGQEDHGRLLGGGEASDRRLKTEVVDPEGRVGEPARPEHGQPGDRIGRPLGPFAPRTGVVVAGVAGVVGAEEGQGSVVGCRQPGGGGHGGRDQPREVPGGADLPEDVVGLLGATARAGLHRASRSHPRPSSSGTRPRRMAVITASSWLWASSLASTLFTCPRQVWTLIPRRRAIPWGSMPWLSQPSTSVSRSVRFTVGAGTAGGTCCTRLSRALRTLPSIAISPSPALRMAVSTALMLLSLGRIPETPMPAALAITSMSE